MKKTIMAVLALALTAAIALTGCSAPKQSERQTTTEQAATERVTEAETTTQEKTTAEETTTEQVTAETAKSAEKPAGIDEAVNGEETSKENLVPLGQWVSVARYCSESKLYQIVYARITKVTLDADYVDAMVKKHNEVTKSSLDLSSADLPDDIEWGIMEYEVYVPEDYPAGEYGIYSMDLDVIAANLELGGFPTADGTGTYLALGSSSKDLKVESVDRYQPGNTYPQAFLFAMVKGYEKYCFQVSAYKAGTEGSSENAYSVYFAKGEAGTESVTEPVTEEEKETEEKSLDVSESEKDAAVKVMGLDANGSGKPDLSGALDIEDLTEKGNAAPVGRWVKASRYCATDKLYHTVYIRMKKVATSDTDPEFVNAALSLHNYYSADYSKIDTDDLKLPSDVVLGVFEYEVYIPEDFPCDNGVVYSADMSFGWKTLSGGGMKSADGKSTYIGLGMAKANLKISDLSKYTPGKTYIFAGLYETVTGNSDYVFDLYTYPDGQDSNGTAVTGYFANR